MQDSLSRTGRWLIPRQTDAGTLTYRIESTDRHRHTHRRTERHARHPRTCARIRTRARTHTPVVADGHVEFELRAEVRVDAAAPLIQAGHALLREEAQLSSVQPGQIPFLISRTYISFGVRYPPFDE